MVRFNRLGALPQKASDTMRKLKSSVSARATVAKFRAAEDGSMTVFTLFIFVMMLMVGGMAVDLMRFETQRAHLQNTLDSAALAATNMNSSSDPTQLVKDIMEKSGYDPALVTVTPDEVYVGADPANGVQGTLAARSVKADYGLGVDTLFMGFLGIDNLGTGASGAAAEGTQAVEISLVVDISGSMAGSKLTALKTAAKNFFTQVIDPQRTVAVTSISIIPYNHAVVVPTDMLDELNDGGLVVIPEDQRHRLDGHLEAYPRTAGNSQCVIFSDAQMITGDLQTQQSANTNPNFLTMRQISPTTVLDKMAYYDKLAKSAGAGNSYARPADDYNRRCDPTRSEILPFETDIAELDAYIDGLEAGGNTAVDLGLKWGVAMLDPAFRPVASNLDLADSVAGRPIEYDRAATMKVIVLMTDGANTSEFDLEADKKTGPSRVWYSEQAANEVGPNGQDWSGSNYFPVDRFVNNGNLRSNGNAGDHLENGDGFDDRPKQWYDGYFVEMPNNGGENHSRRWLRPHWQSFRFDGRPYADDELPEDLVQLDYTHLYDRFSEYAIGDFFRDSRYGDDAARTDHRASEIYSVDGPASDIRMNGASDGTTFGMCDIAKARNDMLLFTIAFQAGSHAETVMRACASGNNGTGYYFPASNATALNDAFSAIAGTITKLRLTQ